VTTILPSTPLFLYMYVRKEALLSSQIEGTQSSLSDLLLFENHEAPSVGLDDVTEVSNYVAAIEHGVSRMAAHTAARWPISHMAPPTIQSRNPKPTAAASVPFRIATARGAPPNRIGSVSARWTGA
jgi:Fic family protein